jgi:hypothetical protein
MSTNLNYSELIKSFEYQYKPLSNLDKKDLERLSKNANFATKLMHKLQQESHHGNTYRLELPNDLTSPCDAPSKIREPLDDVSSFQSMGFSLDEYIDIFLISDSKTEFNFENHGPTNKIKLKDDVVEQLKKRTSFSQEALEHSENKLCQAILAFNTFNSKNQHQCLLKFYELEAAYIDYQIKKLQVSVESTRSKIQNSHSDVYLNYKLICKKSELEGIKAGLHHLECKLKLKVHQAKEQLEPKYAPKANQEAAVDLCLMAAGIYGGMASFAASYLAYHFGALGVPHLVDLITNYIGPNLAPGFTIAALTLIGLASCMSLAVLTKHLLRLISPDSQSTQTIINKL